MEPAGREPRSHADVLTPRSEEIGPGQDAESKTPNQLPETDVAGEPMAFIGHAIGGKPVENWRGRSIVAPVIEDAIAAVSVLSFQTVFPKLREFALAKKGPFTGETASDGGLLYLDEKNGPNKYSREALRNYLRRRQKSRDGRKRA